MSIDVEDLPKEVQKALSLFPEFQMSDFNDTGANGYVLIGRHDVLQKDVAIKIYYHDKSELDQEPAIIASLSHENILKVFDARKVEDYCSFYLMQAANSGDLYSFLEKYNVSTHLAHRLLCQLLSGLACLHGAPNNLVHRDLKPENLLVHDDTLVIADFGSVRQVKEATGKAPASRQSVLYRPIEALGTKAFFDFSSDVYQAGLIGYLLFGGQLTNDLLKYLNPRETKEYEKIRTEQEDCDVSMFIDSCVEKRIRSGKLVDWGTLPFFVPDAVRRILKRATAKKESRYTNTSEFLADLARIRANLPDWLERKDGYHLYGWSGNDYMITQEKSVPIVKKRKIGNREYRRDRSLTGRSYEEIYSRLSSKVGLP
jgi:serine/threonine protein kinase